MLRKWILWSIVIFLGILLTDSLFGMKGELALAGKYQQWTKIFVQSEVNFLISMGFTERVSVSSEGEQGYATSGYRPFISADGRYVTFASLANNLVPGDTNDEHDIFVHDRITGKTERVSVASDGTQGNLSSRSPVISADGRFVAFDSEASNLTIENIASRRNIFLHDRESGLTELVSVASDGTPGNKKSYLQSISADGRYIAFGSESDNLVNGDTNDSMDIFLRDRMAGQTILVSVASEGTQGNGRSFGPSISADGRYIAFKSSASNLVNEDTNNSWDIFVRDLSTGQTERVSVDNDGQQGNGTCVESSISANGRYIAFSSYASNLVSGDTNGYIDVFVHDRETKLTERVSIASDGTQGNEGSYWPSISADGRFVAYESEASKLVEGDTNGKYDIFLYDRIIGKTERISITYDGSQANAYSTHPSLSADGRVIAFGSNATNLVNGDTNNFRDAFVRELLEAVYFLPYIIN